MHTSLLSPYRLFTPLPSKQFPAIMLLLSHLSSQYTAHTLHPNTEVTDRIKKGGVEKHAFGTQFLGDVPVQFSFMKDLRRT